MISKNMYAINLIREVSTVKSMVYLKKYKHILKMSPKVTAVEMYRPPEAPDI